MSRLFLFLCVWLSLWSETVLGSILAIDYGADFIKASLMKPGQPFDVLLNRDSKRKIQSSVGWKKNDRLFGQDAANIVSVLSSRKHILGWQEMSAGQETIDRSFGRSSLRPCLPCGAEQTPICQWLRPLGRSLWLSPALLEPSAVSLPGLGVPTYAAYLYDPTGSQKL